MRAASAISNLEKKTLQPLDNPIGTRLSPMSPVRSVTHVSGPGTAVGDRLRGWGDRTRTLMCGEKIHLFDKSCILGFSHFGGDGRTRWENDLLCWGWTVSSRCVGEKIQEL